MCHSSGHDHAARPQSEGIVGQKKCPGFRRSAQMRIVTRARCWVGPVIACSSSVPCCISARAQRAEKLGGACGLPAGSDKGSLTSRIGNEGFHAV